MTGKVFSDSTDVYQDQAKILFDYYRQAAERIVADEMAIEQQMGEAEQGRQQATANAAAVQKRMIIILIAGAIISIALAFVHPALTFAGLVACGVVAFKSYLDQKAENTRAAECTQRLYDLQAARQNIRRSYGVSRIGVAYVPVARRVRMGDRSYMVDLTGDVPESEFSLTLINQPDELKDAMDGLRSHMEEMPLVESNEEVEEVDTSDYSTSVQDITLHDYMGSIDRQIRNVRYLVNDNHDVSVSIPVIPPTSERYQELEAYTTTERPSYPVIPVFDARDVQQKTVQFSSLGALNRQSAADGSGDVAFFVDVMRQLAQGVDVLARSRTASVSKLVNYSSHILQCVLKASFDQYSPMLESEEIERIRTATFNYADEVNDYTPFSLKESSRVRYDIFADAWIADNGSRTAMPFGMHQVDSEVLMPVINNLMQENRVERLRIYSDIQNQKIDYLNQWHRDTDDFFGRNRTEANALIQRMNEAYAEFVESYTNYQQQSAAIASMKTSGNLADAEVREAENQEEVIAGFQIQTNEARKKQDEFTQFMDRIRDDIDQSAERFGHVEYYEASLRDFHARAIAQAAANVRELDARRQRLAQVSPYLAQEGNVPPEPKVSERLNQDFTINLSGQAENQIVSILADGRAAGEGGVRG